MAYPPSGSGDAANREPEHADRLADAVPTRKRPYRSQTRRQVLDAAFAVFSEHGIAAGSLNEVAAAAGLTKGAVYSNFASKDDLVLALMEEHAAARTDAALAGFASAEDSRHGLVDLAAALAHAMRADAAWHRLLAEYFAMSAHDPRRREGLRRRRREVRDTAARAVARVADGLDTELPFTPAEMATVMLALSNGLAVEADIDPDAVPEDLLGRVLLLIAGDAVTAARTRSDS
ncbi:TetR family transcriptional regulator [Catenulispora pinisilvae]|uniref:TetR family transcriptional regulator n=1 Tax=Catenulispora pinisilvae TaxID=2705253 RepID=UPI002B268270|nr:TetR family transcriptional regulator [Catenulispora pinisilvae]